MPRSSTSTSEPPRNGGGPRLAGAFQVVLGVLLALILFEGFLRLPPNRSGVSPATYDPQIGYWHKPNFTGTKFSACYASTYSFDDAGRRPAPRETPGPKAVVIGDSQVEALMIPDHQVVHAVLAARLDHRVEVLNYGLSSTGPLEQYVILREKVPLDDVRWVIQIINLDSDVAEADPLYERPTDWPRVRLRFDTEDRYELIPPPPPGSWLRVREVLARFELFAYVRAALAPPLRTLHGALVRRRVEASPAGDEPWPRAIAWRHLVGSMKQTKRLLDERGIAYLPAVWALDPTLIERLAPKLADHGVPFLDLRTALIGPAGDPGTMTFPCDNHFTADAHARIADVIARSGLFDDLAARTEQPLAALEARLNPSVAEPSGRSR